MPPAPPPRLGAPIVLAHGLLGFARWTLGPVTLASYFKGVPEFLRSSGNAVIQTAVPPTGSIARRAEELKRQIDAASPDAPVHIIAHSMGGLDARHMISRLGMENRVLSLTTLGAPHLGSPFADKIHNVGARLGLFGLAMSADIDLRAFDDLRTETCARFDAETPDAPGVNYFSVAGVAPPEHMLYALRISQRIIERAEGDTSGPNDGLVAASSAIRPGDDHQVWPCDHVNLVGWVGPVERAQGLGLDVLPYYAGLIERLAGLGF